MNRRLIVAVLAALSVSACTAVTPDAGQEAVLVRKPMFFTSMGGVDRTPVTTGRKYVAWSTKAVYVDVKSQQKRIEFDDLMSRDGVPLDFDTSVQFRYTDTPLLVAKFGADDGFFARTMEQAYRGFVRDAVKKRGMNEVAIDATASDAIDKEVTEALKAHVVSAGLPVEITGLTVGRANPPDSIKGQRTETATQEQRATTEKIKKLAEDQRLLAETARAAADNAYRNAMGMNPEQFLTLERIKMLHDVCRDGKCTFIEGGGAVPTLAVR